VFVFVVLIPLFVAFTLRGGLVNCDGRRAENRRDDTPSTVSLGRCSLAKETRHREVFVFEDQIAVKVQSSLRRESNSPSL
jgi:hypothetical protein